MKIDNKYFIPFIIIAAGISAILIGYFTVQMRLNRQQTFRKWAAAHDSLKYVSMPIYMGSDSLSVQSFEDTFVILDFWATWTAAFSERAHEQLGMLTQKYPKKLEVLVAVVQDKPKKVKQYMQRYRYDFRYVNGTKVFERFDLPGVPTQLVFSPEGELLSIFTGRADAARLDSLKKMILNGQ